MSIKCTIRAQDEASAAERRRFDIGIVVPLAEEFRYVLEVAPQLESVSHAGSYFYVLDFGAISAVCCVVGQMGTLPAQQAANRLLEFAEVKMIVVLGVAGSLDDEVKLGDVVVAVEINEFQANSKVESVDSGYEVRYSGRHWPLDFQIREALTNFEFSGKQFFDDWQRATGLHFSELGISDEAEVNCPASVHFGPIASGNVVAASSAYVAEVRRINRRFLAIDMEAAGVAFAAMERIHPLTCLIVRGISDKADEKKKVLEDKQKTFRRYAVRNAAAILLRLFKWDGLLNATEFGAYTTPSKIDELVGHLASALKSCLGGPWIAGVVFGVYHHGPNILNTGVVVPADLSRLQVNDAKIRKLLDSAEEAKNALLGDGDVSKAAKGIAELVERYRSETGSSNVNEVLQGFDEVVLAVLCPDKNDQQVESLLLQADKLEEEIGADAAGEFLKEFVSLNPLIRERYIDVLATSQKWLEIANLVNQFDVTQLSRIELEHGFCACA